MALVFESTFLLAMIVFPLLYPQALPSLRPLPFYGSAPCACAGSEAQPMAGKHQNRAQHGERDVDRGRREDPMKIFYGDSRTAGFAQSR